jgi:GH15 family glucan-1,4-alpha-glucosidase
MGKIWQGLAILLISTGAVAVGVAAAIQPKPVLPLNAAGVTYDQGGRLINIPLGASEGYLPGTNVLAAAAAGLEWLIAEDRAWLATGTVPGAGTPHAAMVERALLDLRALSSEHGVPIAANRPSWRYVWPRDAAFAVAAMSATGHHEDAETILRFLWRAAPADGIWHARYRPDGSGEPPDDREPQLDGSGWVPWALWIWKESHPDQWHAELVTRELGAIAISSADALMVRLGKDGLPHASPDYWERRESRLTLGTAALASVGLRAAAQLAPVLEVDGTGWQHAAATLDNALETEFGSAGYPRTLPHGGADAAIAFLGPPFTEADDAVEDAIRSAATVLAVPNGGLRPGESWRKDVDVAWTPATGLVALALAGIGDDQAAKRLLTWMDGHRTTAGAIPEKVDAAGQPATVAPLGLAAALVILTVVELEEGLPVLPSTAGVGGHNRALAIVSSR